MTNSFTTTFSETFTITHARQLASKVGTDLHRFHRFYGSPSLEWIEQYERELAVLLKYDVVRDVVYGFKRTQKWTEAAIRYVALAGGHLQTDDDPGKIRPGLDIANASFTSFLRYNERWLSLPGRDQTTIREECPFLRGTGDEPSLEVGYWADDLQYVAGGRGLSRSLVRR